MKRLLRKREELKMLSSGHRAFCTQLTAAVITSKQTDKQKTAQVKAVRDL